MDNMKDAHRGQIAGQIFIYIMVVIVIGIIALIGYNAIKNITQKSCQVEQLGFKTDLESDIAKYNSYGSVNKKILPAPCDYDEVCFVAANATTGKIACDAHNIIAQSYDQKANQNIFVVSKNSVIPMGYSNLITVNDPTKCTCIPQKNGNFYVTFIGQGSRTNVTAS